MCGVEAVLEDGEREQVAVRFVIGADGPGSTIARLVGAEHYREVPAQQTSM